MSSIMKGIVDEGAMSIAGLMTNFDDPNNLTIRDPDTYRYIPAKQYFQSHPEQQPAWQSAWQERLNKRKQQAEYEKMPKVPHPYSPNSQVTPDEANTISSEMASRYLSPEEQQKYKALYAKDQFAAGRFLKQVWNKKTDQKQFANLLKVHWTSVKKLSDFLSGKIPNKAELSAVMYKSTQELPAQPSWGTGSEQVGLILDGWTTIAGRQDLGSDNQRVGKDAVGTRSHQKYTHEPESVYLEPAALRTTKAELGTGWNEALVDNWKVKGIVVPQGASEETINMVKQTKLPITYTGQPQSTRESSIMKGIVDETPAKKGADGKRCWKGKRYAGTENGKDKCIPVKNEAANPAQQAAIAINMKKQGKKPKNVDEASGTPGGVEMFRTKDMVDLAMQQNLYKRDLEALTKAKQAEKPKPAYRKREPVVPGEEHSIHLASTAIPTALVKDWIENKSVSAVVDFIASRYAHRQSTKMIDEIKADPKFVDAVSKFFDIAGKSLELRSKVKAANTTVNDSRFRVEAEDLRLSGFAAFREITNVIVDYMKKYGVDKTGRRVPPGFNYNLEEGVIVGNDMNDPEVAVLGGAGTMSLSRLKKKAHGEALQLADDIANGKYSASSYNMKQLHNTLNTIVAAEEEMKKKYFGEDYTGEFAAEATPAVNPYGGQRDIQHRGAISETPTDNPTGASGEGGWRKYKPKSAGEIEEGQIYSTGGGCGQSYRKFTPKSAGTFEEEQLDEKCWDTHKQVGMKKKGDKMVPNCVPKESAIMKGLKLS